jgi:hypothetical protein
MVYETFQFLEERWKNLNLDIESNLLNLDGLTYTDESNLVLSIKENHISTLDISLQTPVGKGVVCGVFEISLDHKIPDHNIALFTLIERGVPILIWSRTCSQEADILQCILRSINFKSLQTLPEQIKNLRNDARYSQGWHLGRSVTLLWDDPTRLPPGFTPLNQYQ